jgi:hypothetical protein
MKRFYCSICQQVKRVRRYPAIIETPSADKPIERVGVCNFHSNPVFKTRPESTNVRKVAK